MKPKGCIYDTSGKRYIVPHRETLQFEPKFGFANSPLTSERNVLNDFPFKGEI